MEPIPQSFVYMQLLGFFISLFFCAIFSFLETSITALRLFKLKELEKNIKQYKALFQILEKDPHRILITILIAASLSNVTAAALITHLMESTFARLNLSQGLGFSLGIGLATTAILIFGEVIPKNFARSHGERFLHSTLWITNTVFYILYPFVSLLTRISNFFVYRFAPKHATTAHLVTSESEIQFLIDYIDEKGLMDSDKTAMLRSIFSLGKTPVKEIMVPEMSVVAIDARASLQEALDIFCKHQFTRLPVYEHGSKNNIIGFIHQKDIFLLLSQNKQKPLKEILRPLLFVHESLKVNQLLRELRQQHMHMAMVLNEYGSITGLVTLEDAIEEIVGEIKDEYEPEVENIMPLKDGGWLVDARTDLDDLRTLLNIDFHAEASLTLGGFLAEQLQHLPKKGERLLYKGFYFQVQKASPKRVIQVLIFQEKITN